MNKTLGTILVFCGALALADEDINQKMDAASDGIVTISNVAGSVDVQGWSRNEVEVTGTIGDDVEELVFERDDDEIMIKVKVPRRGSRDISSKLDVKIPAGSSVRINTVSADIDVENVAGEQRLEAVSGDITTAAAGSDIDVKTVSGDVEVGGENQTARTRLNSVSGDIDAEDLAGEIVAESVSGDIAVTQSAFERASLQTVNGDVVFHARLHGTTRLDIETINGEVDIELADEISARYDIETFNGQIRNCFGPEPVRTSRYAPGRELKFTEGGGTGRVTIRTLNGDLRLCRR